MFQEIYIIDDDIKLTQELKNLFQYEKEFIFKNVKTEEIVLL